MQLIDTRIVHKSNELQGYRYGRDFIWSERSRVPSLWMALLVGMVGSIIQALLSFRFIVHLALRFLPKPGMGPSEDVMNKGFMKIRYWLQAKDSNDQEVILRGGLTAMGGDPGYKLTACMLTESALCIALEEEKLPKNFGVITPSVAFGNTLRERLGKKDFHFYVDKE